MKVVIIILILIVVGFVVAIGVAVYRATTPPAPPSAHGPPTGSDGKIDEDALAEWEPPSIAKVMGKLSRPFAPKLFKEAVEVTGRAGSGLAGDKPGEVQVPPADKGMRIARLRLIEGKGAVAIYQCVPTQEGETCPQRVCLCPENRILETDEVSECEEPWRKARAIGDDQFRCREKDDDVSAVIYRLGGTILVTPMGEQPARVSVR
jgi:hypothetical protein